MCHVFKITEKESVLKSWENQQLFFYNIFICAASPKKWALYYPESYNFHIHSFFKLCVEITLVHVYTFVVQLRLTIRDGTLNNVRIFLCVFKKSTAS